MIDKKKFGFFSLLGTSILAGQAFAMDTQTLEDSAQSRVIVIKDSEEAPRMGTGMSPEAARRMEEACAAMFDKSPSVTLLPIRGTGSSESAGAAGDSPQSSTTRTLGTGVGTSTSESDRETSGSVGAGGSGKTERKRAESPKKQETADDENSDIRKIVASLLQVITSTESRSASTELVLRTPQTTGSRDGSLQLWTTLTARSSNKSGVAGVLTKVKLLEDVELSQLRLARTRRVAKEKTVADERFSRVKEVAAQRVAQGEFVESKGQDGLQASGSTWESDLVREIESLGARASVWKFLLEMEVDSAKRTALQNAGFFNKELASMQSEFRKFSEKLTLEREATRKNACLPYDDSRGMTSGRAEFALRDLGVESFFSRDYKLPQEIESAVGKEIKNAKKAKEELRAAEENNKNAKWKALLATLEQSETIQAVAREADLAKERVKMWTAVAARAATASKVVVSAWETILTEIDTIAQLEDEAEDLEVSGRVSCALAVALEQAMPMAILKLEQETQLLARAIGTTASTSAESQRSKAELFQSRIRGKAKEPIRGISTAVIEAARAEYARKKALVEAKKVIAGLSAAENAESSTWQEILKKTESTKEDVRRAEYHLRAMQDATSDALETLKTAIGAAKMKAMEVSAPQQGGAGSAAGATESKGDKKGS